MSNRIAWDTKAPARFKTDDPPQGVLRQYRRGFRDALNIVADHLRAGRTLEEIAAWKDGPVRQWLMSSANVPPPWIEKKG